MIPLPDNKKYQIVYADPPWQYRLEGMKVSKGKRWTCNTDKHYDSLSTKEICQLPVDTISDTDCLLFLWVVSPMLEDGIEVGKAWGFEYKTVGFVWDKMSQPVAGYYTCSQCELCLVFKNKGGKIPRPRGARNIRQLVSVKRGAHSVKPLQVKERIDKMFPTQLKIELFARPGLLQYIDDTWDYWGNEVDQTHLQGDVA